MCIDLDKRYGSFGAPTDPTTKLLLDFDDFVNEHDVDVGESISGWIAQQPEVIALGLSEAEVEKILNDFYGVSEDSEEDEE